MVKQYSNLLVGFTLSTWLFLVALSPSANASEISYTFTGDYTSLASGVDFIDLVGASFVYTSTFEREPSICTVGVGFVGCAYFVGTASLTLTGTIGGINDGVAIAAPFKSQSIRQEPFLTYFSGSALTVGGIELDLMNLVPIDPALFTGVGSLLPELTPADIFPGTAFAATDHFANVYTIENITVTSSVPEPMTATLVLLGLLGLRRKLQLD